MAAKNYFLRLLDKFWSENFKPQIEIIPLVPETNTQQKNDLSPECWDFGYRPLTEVEKKEFVNLLDAKGKQILAELEGKPIGGRRRKPLPNPSPIDAKLTSNWEH